MQNQNTRGFWGVIIPVEILDSKELNANEKIIYGYIASYTKMCLDTNEKIAERLNVSTDTVSRAIKKLEQMQYLFVEFINNNTSKRRIYAIYENPRKIAYLARRGMFKTGVNDESYPQTPQNAVPQNEIPQNAVVTPQLAVSQNGGEIPQNAQHRIKEEKEEEQTEQKPNGSAGLAGEMPARRPRPNEYKTHEEFVDALYNWNTIPIKSGAD